MSVKQHFLDELRASLRKYPSGAVDDYVDYYDELISERIESGESEAAVLHKIGSPKDAAAGFKQDNAIDRAVKKPTVSNGVKALLAVLGVLSLPLLIPVAAVVGVLLLVCAVLVLAGIVALAGGMLLAISSVIDMAVAVFSGDAPVYLLILTTGLALVAVFAAFELLRGLLSLVRKTTRALVGRLGSRHAKRKQQQERPEER